MQKSSAIQLKLSSFKFWKHCSNRVNGEIINQIIMELVVIEKNAYLQLKLQIESLSAQIESVKKKIGPVEMEK